MNNVLSSLFSRRFTSLAALLAGASLLGACAAPVGSEAPEGPIASEAEGLHVARSARIEAIAAGAQTSYALAEDGTVWAWGSNNMGALGNGAPPYQSSGSATPVKVPLPARATKISA